LFNRHAVGRRGQGGGVKGRVIHQSNSNELVRHRAFVAGVPGIRASDAA
jgi:hypothetical protein